MTDGGSLHLCSDGFATQAEFVETFTGGGCAMDDQRMQHGAAHGEGFCNLCRRLGGVDADELAAGSGGV